MTDEEAFLPGAQEPGPESIAAEPARRVEQRPYRARAHLELLALPGRPSIEVRTLQISIEGLRIMCPRNLPPGTVCQLSTLLLQRPIGHTLLRVQTVVQTSLLSSTGQGFQLDLRLHRPDAAQLEAIANYLKA